MVGYFQGFKFCGLLSYDGFMGLYFRGILTQIIYRIAQNFVGGKF